MNHLPRKPKAVVEVIFIVNALFFYKSDKKAPSYRGRQSG